MGSALEIARSIQGTALPSEETCLHKGGEPQDESASVACRVRPRAVQCRLKDWSHATSWPSCVDSRGTGHASRSRGELWCAHTHGPRCSTTCIPCRAAEVPATGNRGTVFFETDDRWKGRDVDRPSLKQSGSWMRRVSAPCPDDGAWARWGSCGARLRTAGTGVTGAWSPHPVWFGMS